MWAHASAGSPSQAASPFGGWLTGTSLRHGVICVLELCPAVLLTGPKQLAGALSGVPTGRSGTPSEARKGPKSKIGPPAAPFKWEAWGGRRRFRPLETVGTASNMHVMA